MRIVFLCVFGLMTVSAIGQQQHHRKRIDTPLAVGAAGIEEVAPSTLFNGWKLSPAGTHLAIKNMPLKMVISPDGKYIAVVCGGLEPGVGIVDLSSREITQFVAMPRAWNGVAFSNEGKQLYVTGGNSDQLSIYNFSAGHLTLAQQLDLDPTHNQRSTAENPRNFLAGIAVHPETGKLYICNEATSEIWVVSPASGKVEAKIACGDYPHSCLFTHNPRYLVVSNWGERSVSIVDVIAGHSAQRLRVGVRPNDMVLGKDGRVFVACAGDNTVHVIQTHGGLAEEEPHMNETTPPRAEAAEIITTSLYPASPEGSTPDALAISPDGKVLFVANADNNDVEVVDISKPNASAVVGFVPTGWYPTAVASDGKHLYVANGKGLTNTGDNLRMITNPRIVGGILYNYETGMLKGSISIIDEPTQGQLAQYTQQVRENCPFTPEMFKHTASASDSIIPAKVGEACPIKHVLYIIKENRTYDQVLGDLKDASGKPLGNGKEALCMFGEEVSPNHHELARDFVTLDNLYCNGEVSQDGHSWCDGAIANDFNQRSWTVRYTKHGFLTGNDDMENPASGFLWDLCRRHGVSYKIYGEMVRLIPSASRGTWSAGRDMNRVEGFIKDLHAAEASGDLPSLMIMSLGEDHTRGTNAGDFTPKACVASNDIGLGKIVAALSQSKFWKETAIFVIEDDAQNGPDHVDSHRTVGLVVSPWCRRHVVDSTPYTTASMVRTMELILGLPPMTQYDAGATPMFNCFAKTIAEEQAYVVRDPKIDVNAKNTKFSFGAALSAKMDFSDYDLADEDELNHVLWGAIKGADVEYPVPVHGALLKMQ